MYRNGNLRSLDSIYLTVSLALSPPSSVRHGWMWICTIIHRGIRGEPRYLEGVARFTKLHGSVDWVDTDKTIRRAGVPLGAESIDPYLQAPGLKGAEALRVDDLSKLSEGQRDCCLPVCKLFRDFAAAVCRPNNTLISFGYSFGDEHINRVIEDMLTIPSTHLVVISYDDPLGRIMRTYEKLGRHAQVTLLIGNHLGGFSGSCGQLSAQACNRPNHIPYGRTSKGSLGHKPAFSRGQATNSGRRRRIMTQSPFQYAESLRIGTVDFVSPDEIKVLLILRPRNPSPLIQEDRDRFHGSIVMYLFRWMTVLLLDRLSG